VNETTTTSAMGRRKFLKKAGLVGAALPVAGGMVAAACYEDPSGRRAERASAAPPPAPTNTGGHNGNVNHSAGQSWQEMDKHHKEGVDLFLKNMTEPITKGKGGVPLEYRMDGDVKVFELTCDEVEWETTPGNLEKARAYNGMLPGPIIRATEGERVRINVKNNLTESTAIHWHGLLVPNNMDGVTFLTQDPITPGSTFTYEFTLRNSGSHMYHSHHNAMDQVNRGLLGAFIVDPKDPSKYPQYDREFILVLNDTLLGFTINGKGFPATEAMVVKKGERVLLRWMNEGLANHPMHLHGMPMEVFARDGYPINPPFLCDTLDVPPGNRFDCIVEADEPGVWAFHCHVLSHADSPDGMFGMVTVMIVQE
jgi:manganese oxidase